MNRELVDVHNVLGGSVDWIRRSSRGWDGDARGREAMFISRYCGIYADFTVGARDDGRQIWGKV